MAIRRIIPRLPSKFIFMLFFTCYLIYACGGGGNDSSNDPATTGAILFDIHLNEDSIAKRAGQALSDGACEDYNLESINVDVKNSADTVVASQSWACSKHPDTIADVPVGSNLSLSVVGIVQGKADWQGQATGITVTAGQETDIGMVVINHIAEDATPPTVSAHYPTSGSTEVPISATITVTFSKPIASDSVNSSSCIVTEDGASDPVGCTISYSDASRQVSISPISQLAPNTNYTVTITTEIRDLADLHMTSDQRWFFTTSSNSSDRSLIWDKRNWNGSLWN